MDLQPDIWKRLLLVEREFKRRNEPLSRGKIKDIFQVPEDRAKKYKFALDNRDIIRLDPFKVVTGGAAKELVIADLHIPFNCKLTASAILNYADELQPDVIVLLGDLIDFYKASRWVKNPTKKSVFEEVAETKNFLRELRERFPKARIIYKKGNHEDRLDHYIMQNAGEIYALVDNLIEMKLGLHDLNIEFISEPFQVGKLWHLHGHEKPGGSYNPEYITNVMWKYCHDHFICGHFHRNQTKTFKRIGGKLFWGAAVGYAAQEMEYAILNQWSRGFAVINFDEAGNFKGEVKAVHDGEIY